MGSGNQDMDIYGMALFCLPQILYMFFCSSINGKFYHFIFQLFVAMVQKCYGFFYIDFVSNSFAKHLLILINLNIFRILCDRCYNMQMMIILFLPFQLLCLLICSLLCISVLTWTTYIVLNSSGNNEHPGFVSNHRVLTLFPH